MVNWANYQSVVDQLREAGLLVEGIEVGKRQRVRVADDSEKRGWYHLHELRMDSGDIVLVGSFGVWRGAANGATKILLDKRERLTPEQVSALKLRMAADRKAADAARHAEAARAAARATAMWSRLQTTGESEYLTRKAVAPHGVRFAASGAMLLPLLDVHGKIHGLQAIYPAGHPKRKRLGRDKDFWPAGLQKQGHFFLIGSPASVGLCLLSEGYATAASLHEATGLPVAVCFDAGNLVHAAAALRSRWTRLRVLVCADDDYLGKCRACGAHTPTNVPACGHCGQATGAGNAGMAGAEATALAVGGSLIAPRFAAARPLDKKGPTDWNDLHLAEGLHVVRSQIESHLTALKWRLGGAAPATETPRGGGGGDLRSITMVDELHERFALVYEAAETVFDAQEHKLVPLASMRNLCASRQIHRAWMESADKRVVRLDEVGFDPGGRDEIIKCNLWAGWPTAPGGGSCERLLALGEYLCSEDPQAAAMWHWLIRWLAYPVQHPGAKMKTAVIMHGPQGTGKNLFFEAMLGVYGNYGQVVDQDAIEDKHNDYLSRKLMLVADEVVARMEMFHAKNKLKGLVTSDWIRINPKFVASYRERNHVNLAFLSNEIQPMALERDDRRYGVIWTPVKWEAEMYNAVLAEIEAGGIAALHRHLLQVDLTGFGPATLPPMTRAKQDLIDLGMESSERFYVEWTSGYLPLPVASARSEDMYLAYRHWCGLQGVQKPAQLSTCVGSWSHRPGVRKARERHFLNQSHIDAQSVVLHPPSIDARVSKQELTDSINRFNDALREWKKLIESGGKRSWEPGPSPPPGADEDRPY